MIEVMPNSIGLSYTVALLIGIGYALIMVSRQGGKDLFYLLNNMNHGYLHAYAKQERVLS